MVDAKTHVIKRVDPRDSCSEHELQVLELVEEHVRMESTAMSVPEDLIPIAKSLVKKGLLFWCGDYTSVMNYRKSHG